LIAPLGIYQMLLVGAAGLIVQLQITSYVDRRESDPAKEPATAQTTHVVPAASVQSNAFALVIHNRYLLSIGLMLMVFFCVDATGEYILGSIVSERAAEAVRTGRTGGLAIEQVIGGFYSRYFALVNIGSLLLQLLVVSRIVKYAGVSRAAAVQPALAVLAYVMMGFVPVLGLMLAAKISEKSMDYSLNNTVRNMLFLPCTREEKYSAKQVIDSLFVRLGDVTSALVVFVGTTIGGLGAFGFARFNILLAATGLMLAVLVGRGYRRLTGPAESRQIAQPRSSAAAVGAR
jgi:AAA family ATP:ADP antiporter